MNFKFVLLNDGARVTLLIETLIRHSLCAAAEQRHGSDSDDIESAYI